MSQEFHATYEQGILRLDQPFALPEQTRVLGVVKKEEDGVNLSLFEAMTDDEFELELDKLSLEVTPLPSDCIRADIYLDHD